MKLPFIDYFIFLKKKAVFILDSLYEINYEFGVGGAVSEELP